MSQRRSWLTTAVMALLACSVVSAQQCGLASCASRGRVNSQPSPVEEALRGGSLLIDDDQHIPHVDYAVRLKGCCGETSVQAGRLEMYYKDEWGTICDEGFGEKEAHVACYSLGFSREEGIALRRSFGPGSSDQKIFLRNINCLGNETELNECRHPDWNTASPTCNHCQDLSLACIDKSNTIVNGYPTRLVNDVDNNTLAGRLEIFHKECWGTVCDDNFDTHDAIVACRSIDPSFRTGRVLSPSEKAYGAGEGVVWLDEVECDLDNDINIGYCAHRPWGVVDCHHAEDVELECAYGPCYYEPCENGGTCTEVPGSLDEYTCACQEGYFGLNCNESRCDATECLNGGTCQVTGNVCNCAPHYKGEYCADLIGGCEANSHRCLNGATCDEFGIEFNCTCDYWYRGEFCQEEVGGCESEPCQNNATCMQSGRFFSCECPDGLTGTVCDTLIMGCDVNHCLNGGTCEEQGQDYTCHCTEHYRGRDCQEEIGGCERDRCLNGATCVELGIYFECQCPEKFSGLLCEGMQGGCDPDLCQNGATCIESGPTFRCTCPIGYTGIYCDSRLPPSPCGDILQWRDIDKVLMPDNVRAENWTTMCTLGDSAADRLHWNTTCTRLLDNIYYTFPEWVISQGGQYGCWATNNPHESNIYHACKGDPTYQPNLRMLANETSVLMAICIKYVPWPYDPNFLPSGFKPLQLPLKP